jgi:(2Fe-2S) ferredoxin
MRKGGEEVTQAIRDEIKQLELDAVVHTTRTRCNGRCKDACVTIVYPEGTWYKALTEDKGREIVRSHIAEGKVLEESLIYTYDQEGFVAPEHSDSIDGIEKAVKEEV